MTTSNNISGSKGTDREVVMSRERFFLAYSKETELGNVGREMVKYTCPAIGKVTATIHSIVTCIKS